MLPHRLNPLPLSAEKYVKLWTTTDTNDLWLACSWLQGELQHHRERGGNSLQCCLFHLACQRRSKGKKGKEEYERLLESETTKWNWSQQHKMFCPSPHPLPTSPSLRKSLMLHSSFCDCSMQKEDSFVLGIFFSQSCLFSQPVYPPLQYLLSFKIWGGGVSCVMSGKTWQMLMLLSVGSQIGKQIKKDCV